MGLFRLILRCTSQECVIYYMKSNSWQSVYDIYHTLQLKFTSFLYWCIVATMICFSAVGVFLMCISCPNNSERFSKSVLMHISLNHHINSVLSSLSHFRLYIMDCRHVVYFEQLFRSIKKSIFFLSRRL